MNELMRRVVEAPQFCAEIIECTYVQLCQSPKKAHCFVLRRSCSRDYVRHLRYILSHIILRATGCRWAQRSEPIGAPKRRGSLLPSRAEPTLLVYVPRAPKKKKFFHSRRGGGLHRGERARGARHRLRLPRYGSVGGAVGGTRTERGLRRYESDDPCERKAVRASDEKHTTYERRYRT